MATVGVLISVRDAATLVSDAYDLPPKVVPAAAGVFRRLQHFNYGFKTNWMKHMFLLLHFKQRLASRFRGIGLPQRRRQQRNFTGHEGNELAEDMTELIRGEANTKTKRKTDNHENDGWKREKRWKSVLNATI
jgi:hypothetical protein